MLLEKSSSRLLKDYRTWDSIVGMPKVHYPNKTIFLAFVQWWALDLGKIVISPMQHKINIVVYIFFVGNL